MAYFSTHGKYWIVILVKKIKLQLKILKNIEKKHVFGRNTFHPLIMPKVLNSKMFKKYPNMCPTFLHMENTGLYSSSKDKIVIKTFDKKQTFAVTGS